MCCSAGRHASSDLDFSAVTPSFHPNCAGIVVPELLDGTNHIAWFRAGETIFEPSGINYLGVPGLINAHNIIATLIVQVGRDAVLSCNSNRCACTSCPVSAIAATR